jgi:hypothetical protein
MNNETTITVTDKNNKTSKVIAKYQGETSEANSFFEMSKSPTGVLWSICNKIDSLWGEGRQKTIMRE